MTLYFISGLGADRRVFSRLALPAHYRVVHLEWIPERQKETLEAYALRLAAAIDTSEPFVLIGLSFGGMLAVEIAKVLPPERLVLISSATSVKQLLLATRLAGALRLDRLLPASIIKTPAWLAYYLQGAHDKPSRDLLHALLHKTDERFLLWASRAILDWKNKTIPPNLWRIHGNRDRIIPINGVPADYIVEGGGHFAVFTHAAEVQADLLHCLERSDRHA